MSANKPGRLMAAFDGLRSVQQKAQQTAQVLVSCGAALMSATLINRAVACVWHPPGYAAAALPATVQPSTAGSGSALGICCARLAQGRRQLDSLR